MSPRARAWQGEDGDWTIWGTHNPSEAEEACYQHLVVDVGLNHDADELWDLLPEWSQMTDPERTHRFWADRDLIDLEGVWPWWKFSRRWSLLHPFRVRVLRVLL